MLLWRPNERNKYIFLFELMIISACAHGVLGFLLFVLYKDGASSLHIELGQSRNPTLFVPLKRSSLAMAGYRSSQSDMHQTPKQSGPSSPQAKKSVPGTAQQKALPHKRAIGSDTSIGFAPKSDMKKAAPESNKYPTVTKKPAIKKIKQQKNKIKDKVPKKIAVPKNEPLIKEIPKKAPEEIVQPQPVPIVAEQHPATPIENTSTPQTEPIALPTPLPTEQETKQPELPLQPDTINTENKLDEQKLLDGMPMDEIIIGSEGNVGDYMNAEEAHMHECIEQEIMARWKLPRGLPKELACQIKCCMGANGSVSSCTVEKTSGVLIYDMAARSAARAMTLPRWAWGKEFTIVFKQ